MREKIKIEELIKKLEISKSHLYRSLDKKIQLFLKIKEINIFG